MGKNNKNNSIAKEVSYKGVPSDSKIAMTAMHRIDFGWYARSGHICPMNP